MFLFSWYKLIIYYTTYIITDIKKTLIKATNKTDVKYKKPQKPVSGWISCNEKRATNIIEKV